jgi:hypothetical protein
MEEDSSVVVKVNGNVLTKADLEAGIPAGLTAEDSTIAAEYFIRTWINAQLKYDIASKNITDRNYINQLVDNYRKSLTIYQYEEQLVNEKVSKEIDEQALLDYFEANKDKFKVENPIVKGLFLKVPVNAPQIDKVRFWYKSLTGSNISNIENYCNQNAAIYGYFVDNWMDFHEIIENWTPREYKNEYNEFKSKYIELQDDNYHYFLHLSAYLNSGDNAPFEYARPAVKEILINQQRVKFLKNFEEDLYNKALNSRQISFYNK